MMFFEAGNHRDLAAKIIEVYYDKGKLIEIIKNASERYEFMRWQKTKKNYLKIVSSFSV